MEKSTVLIETTNFINNPLIKKHEFYILDENYMAVKFEGIKINMSGRSGRFKGYKLAERTGEEIIKYEDLNSLSFSTLKEVKEYIDKLEELEK